MDMATFMGWSLSDHQTDTTQRQGKIGASQVIFIFNKLLIYSPVVLKLCAAAHYCTVRATQVYCE